MQTRDRLRLPFETAQGLLFNQDLPPERCYSQRRDLRKHLEARLESSKMVVEPHLLNHKVSVNCAFPRIGT